MVQHAGHRNFEKLMRNGAPALRTPQHTEGRDGRRHLQRRRLHSFDDRSFETNDEVTLGILDEKTAKKLDAIFREIHRGQRRSTWRSGIEERVAQAQGPRRLLHQRAAMSWYLSTPRFGRSSSPKQAPSLGDRH